MQNLKLIVNNDEWFTAQGRINEHLAAIEAVRQELSSAQAEGNLLEVRHARERLLYLEHCLTSEVRHQIDTLRAA